MKKHILPVMAIALITASAAFAFQNKPSSSRHGSAYEADANATCYGSKSCDACKNCKYCKHCAKEGGTCGVCK